ncbi:MAG: Ribonuclease E [Planctomycetes bacterium ADurb.Bin126]|nr:MAG: Ribonuclease E [Planctomycetes bacterium ADurb.Bin126]HOD82891.1 Rne/Rng family ribonuclease [Phycisphaerae bacterium]HQL73743.1 Rne/Rng family ribonuclease [Phycisphaerae bacterium]
MTKEMLINTVEDQECRIAVMVDHVLEELYVERASSASHVGNIYKGRITNVEAAIQAAFVDFGLGKNGFLHISDVHPKYFPKGQKSSTEAVGRKRPHRERPPIQECLRRGQEVVVQMTKEGIGTKGPTLTTYLSIPGRLLVMMPGMSRLGVSRKIEDDEVRGKARDILAELNPPGEMGFIVRTAGLDRPRKDLQRDMNYLLRLWQQVKHRIKTCRPPSEIYQESDLVIRTLRDVYNSDVDRIVCDNEEVARRVQEFLGVAMPKAKNQVELYSGQEGLFHDAGLETEIEKIYARRVELPSGGSLVIDQAEALVAIDVNSGRFREHSDAETTATKINIQAAKEIARQLRLRDLGGVIVMDFIDMREEKNRRSVEKALREAIKTDRARTKLTRISAFGIIEMTRQRIRPSLQRAVYRTCQHCDGSGLIKTEESVALMVMRNLQRATAQADVARVEVQVTPSVAHHLANHERGQIARLEEKTGKTVTIQAEPDLLAQELKFTCTSSRGTPVAWQAEPARQPAKKELKTAVLPPLELPPEPEEEEAEAEVVAEAPPDEKAMEKAAAAIEEATSVPPENAPPPEAPPKPAEAPAPAAQPPTAEAQAGEAKRRRRGRRGGRRHKKRQTAEAAAQAAGTPPADATQPPPSDEAPPAAQAGPDSTEVLKAIKDFVDREAQKVIEVEKRFDDTVRGKPKPETAESIEQEQAPQEQKPAEAPAEAVQASPSQEQATDGKTPDAAEKRHKTRRGRRGGRRHKKPEAGADAKKHEPAPEKKEADKQSPAKQASPDQAPAEQKPKPKRRRPPRKKKTQAKSEAPAEKPTETSGT